MNINDALLWSDLAGQDDAVGRIVCSLDAGEFNHAWLFVGPRGVGKWTTAKILASALNCEDKGCGRCISCSKIIRELHPDVILVEPEGNFVLKEQVDDILRAVARKNYEGRVKVIIIDDADKMTTEAANSLLKTLEEPPLNVVFILISSNPDSVLPTVLSRCRIVQFRALTMVELVKFLSERHGLAHEEAVLASRVNNGILGNAIAFTASPAKKARRAAILQAVQRIDRMDLAGVSFMAEDFLREIKRPLEELKTKQKRDMDDLKKQMGQADIPAGVKKRMELHHKREIAHEEHQGFIDILNVVTSWYRDILLLHETNREDILVNFDHILLIKEHADRITSIEACSCLKTIEETKQYSRFNVNIQLAFETMLFKVHDIVAVQETLLYP
ncbi:MAG: DNA polymerase III subunit delta' [Rubrobacteridae bacterium]|nr:DNA polymerase III subunit delta' [Rubrobacteridae bacterium]